MAKSQQSKSKRALNKGICPRQLEEDLRAGRSRRRVRNGTGFHQNKSKTRRGNRSYNERTAIRQSILDG